MKIRSYGKVEPGKYRKIKRRIAGTIIAAVIILAGVAAVGVLTSDNAEYSQVAAAVVENNELRSRIAELEAQVADLQGQVNARDEYIASIPTQAPAPYEPESSEAPAPAVSDNNMEQSPRRE